MDIKEFFHDFPSKKMIYNLNSYFTKTKLIKLGKSDRLHHLHYVTSVAQIWLTNINWLQKVDHTQTIQYEMISVSKITYIESGGAFNSTHSLIPSDNIIVFVWPCKLTKNIISLAGHNMKCS